MIQLTAPRIHLLHALAADLIGPFRRGLKENDGADAPEDLKLPPSRWYLTGFLTPEAQREEVEDANEELGGGSDETREDEGEQANALPKKKNFMPASMGLTVFVPEGTRELEVVVRYADYERIDRKKGENDQDWPYPEQGYFWRRSPAQSRTERVTLMDGSLDGEGLAVTESRGLRLQGQVEAVGDVPGLPSGTRAVSLFLVNRRAGEAPGYRDAAYVFQVELEVEKASWDAKIARPKATTAISTSRSATCSTARCSNTGSGTACRWKFPKDNSPSPWSRPVGFRVTRCDASWLARNQG